VHTHEYDDDGVLVRTIVERDGEFDAQQRELVIALDEYEAGLNSFGIPLIEAMSPDNDPDNPKGTGYYKVGPPIRDWAEYAVELEQKKPEWSGDNYLRARKFHPYWVERKKR